MIRYLLIDWDNTVWDFSANSFISLSKCYSELSLEKIFGSCQNFADTYYAANDALWARYRRKEITREFLVAHRFADAFAMAGHHDYELSEKANELYLYHVEHESELVAGARDVLEYLRAKGYVLIVVTNGFSEVQRRKLRNSGVWQLFHHTILSDDAGALKPSRRFFDYAFSRTGAVPEESLVIGDDAESDIAGAVSYGLKCVYLNRFGRNCPYPADYEIHSMSELKNIL